MSMPSVDSQLCKMQCNANVKYKQRANASVWSDHKEADTRMCLHVTDDVQKGTKSIMVNAVDTDVVVILVGISLS